MSFSSFVRTMFSEIAFIRTFILHEVWIFFMHIILFIVLFVSYYIRSADCRHDYCVLGNIRFSCIGSLIIYLKFHSSIYEGAIFFPEPNHLSLPQHFFAEHSNKKAIISLQTRPHGTARRNQYFSSCYEDDQRDDPQQKPLEFPKIFENFKQSPISFFPPLVGGKNKGDRVSPPIKLIWFAVLLLTSGRFILFSGTPFEYGELRIIYF